MYTFLVYLFYPNPGRLTYGSTQIIAGFVLCGGFIVLSFLLRLWRARLTNAITKKLSRAWSSISFWFGLVGLVLIVSRIEKIQFLAMRFLWVIWGVLLVLLIALQYRLFRMRHYEVMPRKIAQDNPGAKYLPNRKR